MMADPTPGAEVLRREGLLASDAAVARVVERFGVPGTGDSARIFDVAVAGGLRFEVLADRGFDIGHAELAGWPMSWRSPVADARPLSLPAGDSWLERFTGGLLVTCGLRSFGRREGAPLHGDVSHRPASAVRVTPSRGRAWVRVEADVEDESVFGPALRLERRIESGPTEGGAWVEVSDDVVNTGSSPVTPALLYHLNLGAPLAVPGTTVEIEGARMRPRDEASATFPFGTLPDPTDAVTEAVAIGNARKARILSPFGWALDVQASETLPWMHEWVLPTRGRWALGIEPATAPLVDVGSSAVDVPAPLGPGERCTYRVRLNFRAPFSARR